MVEGLIRLINIKQKNTKFDRLNERGLYCLTRYSHLAPVVQRMDSTQYPLVSSIAFGSTNPMDGDLSAIAPKSLCKTGIC